MVSFLRMIQRVFWKKTIEDLWKEKSIIWLSGVRRAGKTYLSKSLNNIEYFDCELPRVRKMMDEPEGFLGRGKGERVTSLRASEPFRTMQTPANNKPFLPGLQGKGFPVTKIHTG